MLVDHLILKSCFQLDQLFHLSCSLLQLYEQQHKQDHVHVASGFSVWGGEGLTAQHGDHVWDVWGHWRGQSDGQLELQAD